MNKSDCLKEKWSSRAIGLAVLPFALALMILGVLIVPIAGMIFAVPLMILSFGFMMAKESRACQLLAENR